MKVTVVIPTYNRGYVIGEAIDSVRKQTFTDWEIIVADDGSKDDTAARVAAFGDPRIRYITQPHTGAPAAARNTGIRHSQAEIVAFLDSDDVWKCDKLAQDVAFLDAHPEAAAVFADLEKHVGARHYASFMRQAPAFSRTVPPTSSGEARVLDRREMYLCLLQEVPIMPTAFTIRRHVIERFGGFDPSWPTFEDWELFLRLSHTERFGYIDRPLAVLRVLPDANHLAKSVIGRTTVIRLLRRERRYCRGDVEALHAIRNGITLQRKQLGWHFADHGRRRAAMLCYLAAVVETGRVSFLARAASLAVPSSLLRRVRRFVATPAAEVR